VKKGNCTLLTYKEALERFLVMVCSEVVWNLTGNTVWLTGLHSCGSLVLLVSGGVMS
jgi:hypothetical protein